MKDAFPFEARKFVEKRSKPWTRPEFQFIKVSVTQIVGLLMNGKIRSSALDPRTKPMFWVETWAEVTDKNIGFWEYVTDGRVYYFAVYDVNDKTGKEVYRLVKGDDATDWPRLDAKDKTWFRKAIREYLKQNE